MLLDTTVMIGEDELTVPRLAEALPAETEVARGALEEVLIGEDERINLPAAIARIVLAARAVAHLSTRVGTGTGFMIRPDLL